VKRGGAIYGSVPIDGVLEGEGANRSFSRFRDCVLLSSEGMSLRNRLSRAGNARNASVSRWRQRGPRGDR
jgi:hypothetical protein